MKSITSTPVHIQADKSTGVSRLRSHPNVLSAIGHTPLLRLDRLYPDMAIKLYGKLEANNPGGSIKDRTAYSILRYALAGGDIKPGDTVIESSSGNMAIGLAQACRYYGLNLIVVVDPHINAHTLKLLRAYGVQVDQVQELDPDGGYLKTRLRRVQTLLERVPNSFWTNQYANPNNPLAHRQTMDEIVTVLDGNLDYLFAATSTCGTLMGCAQYVKQRGLPTKIVAVDAVGSKIFDSPPADRLIPGHGAGRKSQLLDEHLVDHVVHITDRECVIGCRRLLAREALLCGGSSGAVTMAVEKLRPELPANATCAMILCDRGERYLDTIYAEEWVQEHFGEVESGELPSETMETGLCTPQHNRPIDTPVRNRENELILA